MKTILATAVLALSLHPLASSWAQTAPALTQTPPQSAPAVSTQDMVSVCSQKFEPLARNFCYGFGEGVYQLHKAMLGNSPDTTICFKGGDKTRDQILDEFVAWANDRPDLATQPAAGTILLFLRQQYPCASKN